MGQDKCIVGNYDHHKLQVGGGRLGFLQQAKQGFVEDFDYAREDIQGAAGSILLSIGRDAGKSIFSSLL